MEDLRHVIMDKVGLKEEHYECFIEVSKIVHVRKKAFLIEEGNVCSFIGFVQEGLLRSFVLKDEEEHNIDFYFPNTFVSAYTSFLTQAPTTGYIQALSDTTICYLSYTQLNDLFKNSNDWYKLGKYIADTFFVRKCKREASLLKDSATERYYMLLKNYPKIEQLIALYHIASYLGIKPESLSRIKSLTYINK